MSELFRRSEAVSRSLSAENPTGEKGKGALATEGTGKNAARELGVGWKVSPSLRIHAHETLTLMDVDGPGMIRRIWITDSLGRNRSLVLRIYWDNAQEPSVAVPLGDFFASGDYQHYAPMNSAMVCVNPRKALNCYWEMPFYHHARITLENLSPAEGDVYYQICYTEETLPEDCLYFHAQFRRSNPLPYGQDHTLLDGITGRGQYVGTYLLWGCNNNGWWGEGEVKFFIDGDTDAPTLCGTGTEDYFCGSWNFEGNDGHYTPFCTPYAGLNKVFGGDGQYQSQMRFSLYRWHVPDPVFFREKLRVTIQALGWRSDGRYLPLQDDISSVAYFYLDHPTDVSGTLPDANGLELI